ncbi:hypothetical protein GCM10022253_28320 [Sphingomonas endophytica]
MLRGAAGALRKAHAMPTFRVAIVDGAASASSIEEHSTIEEAKDRTIRAALSLLLKARTKENRRTATCEVAEMPHGQQLSFQVTLELKDFI